MPLVFAPIGKELKVLKYQLDDKLVKHLQNLGVVVGGNITVVKENNGDVIIEVKGSRIALNKQLARKILVS